MIQVFSPNLAAPFNVTNAAWLEHYPSTLKADMSSHRGRRRTTNLTKGFIAFSSKQGQPLEVPDFSMKKQERIESAQKRIQELKKLIDYWLKNGKS